MHPFRSAMYLAAIDDGYLEWALSMELCRSRALWIEDYKIYLGVRANLSIEDA